MTHEMLECGQGDAVTHHVRSEGVAKPMGISTRDLAARAMVTEQRAEAGWGQGLSTMRAFQTHE